MELFKLLNLNEIIAQIISFLLLLFLLRIFAWRKLLRLLDSRKERIASEFKRIEDTKADIEKTRLEYEARLAKIEEKANQIIQGAIAQGREITDEVRKKAHSEAQDIIDNARQNVKYELTKAKEELRDSIINLTIKATESVIQGKFTEPDDKKLISDFLDNIDKADSDER
jgi:F-type H+-transporting ATPase subunit b